MKKLILLLSLSISIGVFAQSDTPFKFSLEEKTNVVKTLKQENQMKNVASMGERASTEREQKREAWREAALNGLKNETAPQTMQLSPKSSSRDRLDSIIAVYPDGSKWSGQFFTYDENYWITRMHNCLWENEEWVSYEDHTYVWNEYGYCLTYQVMMPAWGEGTKFVYTYDETSRRTSSEMYAYFDNSWEPLEKFIYGYDYAGNFNEIIRCYYDNGWVNDARELVEYDIHGRKIFWEGYMWMGSSWAPYSRDDYEYDAAGNQTSWIISFWGGSSWVYDMKWEHEYNAAGKITLQLLAFWNAAQQNWSGTNFAITERTVFSYDDQNRETSQLFSQLINNVWVLEAEMHTTWTDLGGGVTQSVRLAYDDDILTGGYFAILTMKFNQAGQLLHEEEIQYGWNSHYLDTYQYDANGNELESKSWTYANAHSTTPIADMWIKFTYNSNNKPTSQENYFGQGTGPDDWVIASKFVYEYQGLYRVRNYSYSASGGQFIPGWGWGIDLDFSVPASNIIQAPGGQNFQDQVYDHKILKTYEYSGGGGGWNASTFTRYYTPVIVCPEVINLSVTFNDYCEATLRWNAPEDVEAPVYNVYKNNILIAGNIATNSYTDTDVTPFTPYNWCVTVVCDANTESDKACVLDYCIPRYPITASAGVGGTISPSGNVMVTHAGSQTFNIASIIGYGIDQVLIDGVNNPQAVNDGRYTFTNVTAPHTIEATFKLTEYTLTATAGAGGSILPAGVIGVNYGDTRTFTILPNLGYNVVQVLVDGVNDEIAVANKTYTFEHIDADHTIAVSFQRYGHVITSTAGEGGSINPEGETVVNIGQAQFYTFSPNTGYKVSKVLVDGVNNQEAVNAGMYTFSNVSAAHAIHVDFELKSYAITASATTGGSITPSGVTEETHGGEATFTFAADGSHTLTQVLVDGVNNEAAVAAGSYTFTNITAAHGIQAVFTAKTYEITATAGAGGRISPEGTATVAHGSDKTYNIIPNTGFEISKVLIDGENNATAVTSGSYTFSNIAASHTIEAQFTAIAFKITASVDGGNGEISPAGDVEVVYGETPTFTFTPSAGYKVASVLVDGENKPAAVYSGNYTFAPVTGDYTIAVAFEKATYVITAVATGEGTISPAGDVEVEHGANQAFTFAPAEGYQVGRVVVDHVVVEDAASYTFENVTEKHRIEVVFVVKTGIEENATVQLSAYPNPTSGKLKIENGKLKMNCVRVYNITGKLIHEIANINNTEFSLDMSDFPNGIYFIDVDGKTVKVIKQ